VNIRNYDFKYFSEFARIICGLALGNGVDEKLIIDLIHAEYLSRKRKRK
jgi:hypothetical protein